MNIEIEHKFLVRNDGWRTQAGPGRFYRQGYLAMSADSGIRVSVDAGQASLCIKKAQSVLRRLEFEYPIPKADAEVLLDAFCDGARLEKTRYRVPHAGHIWEIDEFAGANSGLVVAEIELQHEGETFQRPAWIGEEISADTRFLAMNLARKPYPVW
jgi:adenylate cyclase